MLIPSSNQSDCLRRFGVEGGNNQKGASVLKDHVKQAGLITGLAKFRQIGRERRITSSIRDLKTVDQVNTAAAEEAVKIDRGEKRGRPKACVHRSRPVSESLLEFENMKNGKYRPKKAFLRMKQDLEDGNPQMWDLTAYRVLDTPHFRTHDKWKIYLSYDFTHCLVDSFENISHSLCTVAFIASRQSDDWLRDALEVSKPCPSEYGRLAIEGSLTSKRKILSLVHEGYVLGWDNPRLYTVISL